MSAYIVLEGKEHGNCFFTSNSPEKSEEDKLKIKTGEVAYNLIGYADTPEEANELITKYTGKDRFERLHEYMVETYTRLGIPEDKALELTRLLL